MQKIYPDRWFIWTLVFLFVSGLGLVAYMQWANLDIATLISLMFAQV